MPWWTSWFGGGGGPAPGDDGRWVVLDVETSGLDTRHDRLLAIAAFGVQVAGRRLLLQPADSFELVLKQAPADLPNQPDRDNILLHGIGLGAQRDGMEPQAALARFAEFVGTAPLVAFHAAFDRAVIERACRLVQRPAPPGPWLDLEPLAAVLMPQLRARSLDEWMAALAVPCAARHEAAADAWATAELLQRLWPALVQELGEAPRFAQAARLAARRRWLAG